LQQNVDFLTGRKERTNPFDFFDVQGIEKLRSAKFLEDIGELQMAQERIRGFFVMAVVLGRQRYDGDHFIEGAKQTADAVLQFGVAQQHDRLVDVLELDLFVGFYLEQVAVPSVAAAPFDRSGHFLVRN
jgi:hypothetical protein